MEEAKVKPVVVLDASVIVKWFSEEEDTGKALALRENFTGKRRSGRVDIATIAAPDLLVYEIANALRYYPTFDEKDVIQALSSLYDIGIDILVPVTPITTKAVRMAFRYEITAYDATYIALAEEIDFDYITADKKLYEKIKELEYVYFLRDLFPREKK